MVLIAIPFSFEMEYIMKIWLGTPPEYAVLFCPIMVIACCINMCECAVNIGIHATAQVRQMSFFTGVCYLGILPIIYICYQLELPVETAYYLSYVVCTINLIIRSIILRKKIPYFCIRSFALKVIAPIMLIAVVTTFVTNIVYGLFEEGFSRLIIDFMTVFIVGGILTMIIALNREQRQKMVMLIKEKIKK